MTAPLTRVSASAPEPWPGATLRLLAEAHRNPEDGPPPPVPGFILSDFAPLVVDVAERCLRQRFADASRAAERAERTAVVLVSASGDVQTARAIAEAVDSGGRVSALLLYQSVPSSVLGWLASRWGLRGPVVCASPAGDPRADAATLAELLFFDDDADQVLAVLVELGTGDESRAHASAYLLSRRDADG